MQISLPSGHTVLLDDQDADLLKGRRWHLSSQGYVHTHTYPQGKRHEVYLHALIMPCPQGLLPDHISGDPLNNRRQNLRPATGSQNAQNQRPRRGPKASPYKGVTPSGSKPNPWRARIKTNGKTYCIGYHPTDVEAALAYDREAVKLFGQFARTNF